MCHSKFKCLEGHGDNILRTHDKVLDRLRNCVSKETGQENGNSAGQRCCSWALGSVDDSTEPWHILQTLAEGKIMELSGYSKWTRTQKARKMGG